jgi:hypothetical protein
VGEMMALNMVTCQGNRMLQRPSKNYMGCRPMPSIISVPPVHSVGVS